MFAILPGSCSEAQPQTCRAEEFFDSDEPEVVKLDVGKPATTKKVNQKGQSFSLSQWDLRGTEAGNLLQKNNGIAGNGPMLQAKYLNKKDSQDMDDIVYAKMCLSIRRIDTQDSLQSSIAAVHWDSTISDNLNDEAVPLPGQQEADEASELSFSTLDGVHGAEDSDTEASKFEQTSFYAGQAMMSPGKKFRARQGAWRRRFSAFLPIRAEDTRMAQKSKDAGCNFKVSAIQCAWEAGEPQQQAASEGRQNAVETVPSGARWALVVGHKALETHALDLSSQKPRDRAWGSQLLRQLKSGVSGKQ